MKEKELQIELNKFNREYILSRKTRGLLELKQMPILLIGGRETTWHSHSFLFWHEKIASIIPQISIDLATHNSKQRHETNTAFLPKIKHHTNVPTAARQVRISPVLTLITIYHRVQTPRRACMGRRGRSDKASILGEYGISLRRTSPPTFARAFMYC